MLWAHRVSIIKEISFKVIVQFVNTYVFVTCVIVFHYFFTFFPFRDLCLAYGAKIFVLLDTEPISDLLAQGRKSRIQSTKNIATWATKEVRKLKGAATQASW